MFWQLFAMVMARKDSLKVRTVSKDEAFSIISIDIP
jgi:hypothetical protein